MRNFGKILIAFALTAFTATSAMAFDRPGNPPGPVGGPGTNWHNPPGPVGGHGASPSAHHRVLKQATVRHHHRVMTRAMARDHHRHYFRHHHRVAADHGHFGYHR